VTAKAFIDESARSGYFVCAAVVTMGDLTQVRKSVGVLRSPGASRVHMSKERPARRRQILSVVTEMPVRAYLYEAPLAGRSQRAARDDCLRHLVADLVSLNVGHAVLESCDQDHQDLKVISQTLWPLGATKQLQYGHHGPTEEKLLWLPDIIAWAYGAGGDWRRRVMPVIAQVRATGS